ncbi:MAG: helix-turn-helix transcriptional regulator [Clostridia bacterium]|nr:helix-turn-helix transcriptional regulator [Clostridia bacterium]
MHLDMEQISRFLQARRKEAGLTQAELAERLLVSAQSVSNWERGESLPEAALLPDIAAILRCSVDAILSGGEPGGSGRFVTVAQMREAMECIHRLRNLMGPDNFIYATMISALDRRMNSSIEPAFSEPVVMDAYICEALLACVRDCGDRVDINDVRRNIRSDGPREWTIRLLKEMGMR